MATTNVPYTDLAPNAASIADPAGTSISSGAGNGGRIANAQPERTILRIANASGGAATATIKAGTYPPALAASLGDLSSGSIANGAARFMGPFESGRFLQNDGSLIIESSATLTVTAFRIPRGV